MDDLRGAGLNFVFDPASGALYGEVKPRNDSAPIDEAWLRQHFADLGYATFRFIPSGILQLLSHYNSGMAVSGLKVAAAIDASFVVTISPDQLEVTLTIQPPEGGAPVRKDAVLADLVAKGVQFGLQHEAIADAVARGSADRLTIARGMSAVDGVNGRLESLIPNHRSRAPKVDVSGHTDYRDLGEIRTVHAGDYLMRRHRPTPGTQGMTVRGEAILPKPGKETPFAPNLKGVEIAADDPDLLIAAVSGQPVEVKNGMMVEPTYSLVDVDMTTGNIEFDGSVIVKGDVKAGMRVKATGDIAIGGMAEPSILEAGGDIAIKGGAIGTLGKSEGGDCHIRCGGSFSASYVQQVKIDAGDSVFVDDMAMQSHITAANHVKVGNRKRGHITGGHIQATLSVSAKVIGSTSRTTTRIEIGVDPSTHKILLAVAQRRDLAENKMLEASKRLAFATKNPGKVRPEMIEHENAHYEQYSQEIAELRALGEQLSKKINLSLDAHVVAEQQIFEGVEVVLGKRAYRVRGENGPSIVGLKAGLLTLSPYRRESH